MIDSVFISLSLIEGAYQSRTAPFRFSGEAGEKFFGLYFYIIVKLLRR